MKLLLDADMLLFRAMSGSEIEIEIAPDVWTRHSEMPAARQAYWDDIDRMCEQVGCGVEDVFHCFTSASMFRRRLFPAYKQSRKGSAKPIGWKAMKTELMQRDTAFMFNEIEADDLLGIFATMIEGEEVAIASGDKDLMQIPGTHVWMRTEKDPQPEDELTIEYADDLVIKTNTREHAERFTYKQILMGDSTDGIPGCKGIGPITADKIVNKFNLSEPVDCWQEIVRVYETKGCMENASEYATQQARLTRILRADEYDFANHQVILWNPPTLMS